MQLGAVCTSAILALVAAGSAQGAQLTATATTFQTVMAKATGGDTVKLIGSFGMTKLTNKNFASLVTIDATAATFSDALVLTNIYNINVIGGRFGSDTSLTAYDKAIAINGGTNVSFTNPYVTGWYDGQGISFTNTTNASVTGAILSHLQAGIIFANVTGGSISNSKSVAAVGDGFDVIDSRSINIGYNTCTGSTPTVGAHPDCVQLENSPGASPLSYINIHNNYASGETQGFDNFASAAGDSFISIVNNHVDGLFPDGIACNSCINSTITGNTITTLDGAPYQVTLNVNGTNNSVFGNTVGALNKAAKASITYYTREQLIGHSIPLTTNPIGWVPEPAAWTMMIVGFGMVGFSQRRRQSPSPA